MSRIYHGSLKKISQLREKDKRAMKYFASIPPITEPDFGIYIYREYDEIYNSVAIHVTYNSYFLHACSKHGYCVISPEDDLGKWREWGYTLLFPNPQIYVFDDVRGGALEKHGCCCYYCRIPLTPQDYPADTSLKHGLHFDHVIPRSRGGKFEFDNVVPVCQRCNSRKGAMLPADYSVWLASRKAPK